MTYEHEKQTKKLIKKIWIWTKSFALTSNPINKWSINSEPNWMKKKNLMRPQSSRTIQKCFQKARAHYIVCDANQSRNNKFGILNANQNLSHQIAPCSTEWIHAHSVAIKQNTRTRTRQRQWLYTKFRKNKKQTQKKKKHFPTFTHDDGIIHCYSF